MRLLHCKNEEYVMQLTVVVENMKDCTVQNKFRGKKILYAVAFNNLASDTCPLNFQDFGTLVGQE